MKTYKIWLGDGSVVDGEERNDRDDAIESVRVYRGWNEVYVVEHCDGSAWSLYPTQEAADEDQDGAYAATVHESRSRKPRAKAEEGKAP